MTKTKTIEERVKETEHKLHMDITDRRGWRQEWDMFSNDIRKEIRKEHKSIIRTALQDHEKQVRGEVTEDTSDGYHTFKELYEFRLLYNAHLFNEWAEQGKYDVHKSKRHNDGELCFGRDDYFIVVATLPTGQISNHYPMSDWDLFKCEEVDKAKAIWDGHSSQDVAKRLRESLTNK